MGLVKTAMMEAEARGWEGVNKFVCPNCVEDGFLKGVIEANTEDVLCLHSTRM